MGMRTLAAWAVLGALVAANQAFAESWVDKMLSEREHDFGTVARGADTVHRFEIKNLYKQDIELVSVRSSCGCTSPSLENKLLKTGDIGFVVASFNTRTYTGLHSATLTVTVRWDDNGVRRRGEAQLRVHGNIRGDVVFEPGAVKFDGIDQGSKSEQQVRVTYAGRSDWKITDVRGASDDIEVELTETQRKSGRVSYDLLVRMKESAPAGYFNEQLILVTNDDKHPRIPIYVDGRIVPEISVAPESIMFGEVAYGEQVPKKILVRGKKPFKIVSLSCDDNCFEFKKDEKSSERHIIEIVFAAKHDPGKVKDVKQTIHITTDLGERYTASLTAYATILPATGDVPEDNSGNVSASGPAEQVASQ